MSVTLLTNISSRNSTPESSDIQKLIPTGSKLTPSQLEFPQAYESTFYKIRFADYHLSTLEQIYHPHMENREEDTKN